MLGARSLKSSLASGADGLWLVRKKSSVTAACSPVPSALISPEVVVFVFFLRRSSRLLAGGALAGAGRSDDTRLRPALAVALVVKIEERLILFDGAAERSAVLINSQRGQRSTRTVAEEVIRVQVVVTQVLE